MEALIQGRQEENYLVQGLLVTYIQLWDWNSVFLNCNSFQNMYFQRGSHNWQIFRILKEKQGSEKSGISWPSPHFLYQKLEVMVKMSPYFQNSPQMTVMSNYIWKSLPIPVVLFLNVGIRFPSIAKPHPKHFWFSSSGVRDFAFLISFQVMLKMLMAESHFENRWPKPMLLNTGCTFRSLRNILKIQCLDCVFI